MDNLREAVVTRMWLFQAIIAGPTFILLGLRTIIILYDDLWYHEIYPFITSIITATLSCGIVLVVSVQRKLGITATSARVNFWFEAIKSLFATGVWLWLVYVLFFLNYPPT